MKRYYKNWKQISISSFSPSQISVILQQHLSEKTFNIFISLIFFLCIKGTLSLISIYPEWKDANVRFTTVPLKPLIYQKGGRSTILLLARIIYWIVSFSVASHKQGMRSASHLRVENPKMKKNSLKKEKQRYLIHTWSDKAFKGTAVNRALPSFHGG